MSKTMKVFDVQDNIHLICIKNNMAANNPYRLYLIYNARHETYGYYTQRRKCIAQYGDMASILCHVRDMYVNGIQYRSVPDIIAWNKEYYH